MNLPFSLHFLLSSSTSKIHLSWKIHQQYYFGSFAAMHIPRKLKFYDQVLIYVIRGTHGNKWVVPKGASWPSCSHSVCMTIHTHTHCSIQRRYLSRSVGPFCHILHICHTWCPVIFSPQLKCFLGGKHFSSEEELKEWFRIVLMSGERLLRDKNFDLDNDIGQMPQSRSRLRWKIVLRRIQIFFVN